ncbi:PfkB family carbohydrate kinase [Subtercola boreus]|uniref:Carbohydrate kinase PfkB domain-containing protein n=1 Tax=Subtercola boreus TaxID=120213 RepID=A0A3E0WFB5_9MICO|nr:carbohydrate kinase family protein [Subtercola boreus]RFA22811.1 hypothetical protein B7R24_04210 [Subtercola boreus]RFA23166.1 hypothetical protein B7R23_04205 [Subtercola boreus]RFA28919.1 hypothetical protein B7R25_04220 [Subtercola boreus]
MNPPAAEPPARSVVLVGHVCIDENTGTGESGPSRRVPGSPAFFMNRQLQAVAGVDVAVIAPHGSDFLEVDAALPLLNGASAGATLLYRNHIDGDIRMQECFNAWNARPVPIDGRFAAELGRADIVVVCPLLANFGVDYVDSVLAPAKALKMLLVQGYLRSVSADGSVGKRRFDEYANIVPRFDVAVFSDEDMDDALEVAGRWSIEFPRTIIVVTENRRGASYFQAGVRTAVDAHPLDRRGVGSVIGAGDVFSAALAVGLQSGSDIRAAVVRANADAAAFIDGARVSALSGR